MNTTIQQFGKYLQAWLVVLFALLLCVACLNYFVDPYGLFGSTRIQGFNQLKPAASSHVRLAKPRQVQQAMPRTIIAGNSRPEMGIDPNLACWPESMKPVFNMSIPGASVYMAMRNVQHATALSDVQNVIWGLDFKDFIAQRNENESGKYWPVNRLPFEDRLLLNADGSINSEYEWYVFKDKFNSMVSLNALRDSLHTVFSQDNTHAQTVTSKGFNPAHDMKSIMQLEGQGLIFKQKNIEIAELFSNTHWELFSGKEQWSNELESVKQFLKFAESQGIYVKMFINPYHADYLELMQNNGWWPQFNEWKRRLLSLSARYKVELWDFSGINAYSAEPPPGMGDRKTVLRWFWEPAHYRKEYGNLMLSQMLKQTCHEGQETAGGILLTEKNIEKHLVNLEKAMSDYLVQ